MKGEGGGRSRLGCPGQISSFDICYQAKVCYAMDTIDFRSSSLMEIINWLTSLRSVTDFEAPALAQLKEMCEKNNIYTSYMSGGLLIGNIKSKAVFMAHIDRVGFVAIEGVIKDRGTLKLGYVSSSPSIRPQDVKQRFLNTLLIGYDPKTGEDLFLSTINNDEIDGYSAEICCIFKENSHNIVSYENPIPLTPAKPCLSYVGNYLQGFLDNSAGLAIALSVVAKHPSQLSCIVTTSEEGGGYLKKPTGGRGAQEYIHYHDPSQLLVDVRPSSLTISNAETTRVGDGVVLRESEWRKREDGARELLLNAHPESLSFIRRFAESNNIPFQIFSGVGLTEAGRAYEALGPKAILSCIWLQPPVAYMHSPFEVSSLTDLESTQKLAEAMKYI